jgi:histidine triad (HIT) family protein
MSDCLFCKIINEEIPAEIIFENEKVIGFKDINPEAKVHLLFIHKSHSENLNEMARRDIKKVGEVFAAITEYTNKVGLEDSGYRVVTNIGKDGGQVIFHTHFHVLGGEKLSGKFGV